MRNFTFSGRGASAYNVKVTLLEPKMRSAGLNDNAIRRRDDFLDDGIVHDTLVASMNVAAKTRPSCVMHARSVAFTKPLPEIWTR